MQLMHAAIPDRTSRAKVAMIVNAELKDRSTLRKADVIEECRVLDSLVKQNPEKGFNGLISIINGSNVSREAKEYYIDSLTKQRDGEINKNHSARALAVCRAILTRRVA